MSLKFLVAILNWLQEEFSVASAKHDKNAETLGFKIADLKAAQADQRRSAKLAANLAGKIDSLLSE